MTTCDSDGTITIEIWDPATLSLVDTGVFEEPGPASFHNVDVTAVPRASDDDDIVVLFTYQQLNTVDTTVVVASWIPATDDLEFIEIDNASSPSIVASDLGFLADTGFVSLVYYDDVTDALITEVLRYTDFASFGSDTIAIPGGSCDVVATTETVWQAVDTETRFLYTGQRDLGSGCEQVSVLYAGALSGLSQIGAHSAVVADIAVDPSVGSVVWLRRPPAGGWHFGYIAAGSGTETRQSNDIPRSGFTDVIDTSTYFGVMNANLGSLYWNILGCD